MTRDEIIDIICDLYEEFSIHEFNFDVIKIIKKMGINLIPYSSYPNKNILKKFEQDGFTVFDEKNNKIKIFYNDDIIPKQRINFTLPHELGHICLGHIISNNCSNSKQFENEANIFANEFYCPQCFMIYFNLLTPSDLVSSFDITYSYANVLLEKLSKRKNKELTTNERRLISIFEKHHLVYK